MTHQQSWRITQGLLHKRLALAKFSFQRFYLTLNKVLNYLKKKEIKFLPPYLNTTYGTCIIVHIPTKYNLNCSLRLPEFLLYDKYTLDLILQVSPLVQLKVVRIFFVISSGKKRGRNIIISNFSHTIQKY